MSRKRNIKKEMFQPTTECVDSLTIDDVTHWAGCSRVWNRPHGMFGRRWLQAALSVPPVDVSALIGADASLVAFTITIQ